MRHRVLPLVVTVMALLLFVQPAAAAPAPASDTFPSIIDLPNGWLPEGIVTGRGPVIYSGSRANGAIYAANPRTGEGSILVQGQSGRVAVGLDFDARTNYIFVAGGGTGQAYVYDASTGATLATYTLTQTQPTFINDVIVTRQAAYFTDSSQSVLYRLPLGPGGRLPAATGVQVLPLSGFPFVPGQINANGIVATPDGKWLIVVNTTVGNLYRVDPNTGVATEIDLGAEGLVTRGDGLLLRGKTLYVVRNLSNEIVVVRLASDLASGEIVDRITNPAFDVPTTLAEFGSSLYAVNARFTTPPTPSTTYNIVRVPLAR